MSQIKEFYKRNLPHYQPSGYIYFVTFRLAGSLPASLIKRLIVERDLELKAISEFADITVRNEKYRKSQSRYFGKFDKLLDNSNYGPTWLNNPDVAQVVKDAIHRFHKTEYELIAYTIMKNHVHILFKPIVNPDAPQHFPVNPESSQQSPVGRDSSRHSPNEHTNTANENPPLHHHNSNNSNILDINPPRRIELQNDHFSVGRDSSRQVPREYMEVETEEISLHGSISNNPKSLDINPPRRIELQKNHFPIVTDILRKLKGSTARECNKLLNRTGPFWQHESYDHLVRNNHELNRIIEYILNNPVKASFCSTPQDWNWNYISEERLFYI
jgi:REP element-mobilizing transposase RayT